MSLEPAGFIEREDYDRVYGAFSNRALQPVIDLLSEIGLYDGDDGAKTEAAQEVIKSFIDEILTGANQAGMLSNLIANPEYYIDSYQGDERNLAVFALETLLTHGIIVIDNLRHREYNNNVV